MCGGVISVLAAFSMSWHRYVDVSELCFPWSIRAYVSSKFTSKVTFNLINHIFRILYISHILIASYTILYTSPRRKSHKCTRKRNKYPGNTTMIQHPLIQTQLHMKQTETPKVQIKSHQMNHNQDHQHISIPYQP
jgi:hypothetical protein